MPTKEIIDLKWFQNKTKIDVQKFNLPELLLGMTSQVHRMLDAREKKDETILGIELTKLEYYLSVYCCVREINLKELTDANPKKFNTGYRELIGILALDISKLAELVAKHTFNNKEIDEIIECDSIVRIQHNIKMHVENNNLKMETILENNI